MSKTNMENQKRVILYGSSVILGTVGASLKKQPQFEVIALTAPYPSVKDLGEMKPDVILFDLGVPHHEAAFALLESNPVLLLIGVDCDANQALMWSGRQVYELSMQDLMKMIYEDKE